MVPGGRAYARGSAPSVSTAAIAVIERLILTLKQGIAWQTLVPLEATSASARASISCGVVQSAIAPTRRSAVERRMKSTIDYVR